MSECEKSKDVKSQDRHVYLLSQLGWSLTCPVCVSQLIFLRLYQSFLHESKDVSALTGSNNFRWHIEVGLGRGNKKCKPILAAGHETKKWKWKKKCMKWASLCWWSRHSHYFNTRSSVCSVVTALIPCSMVGVSTLKGQSLCVSLETPSYQVKL